jgi:hypothetical protein
MAALAFYNTGINAGSALGCIVGNACVISGKMKLGLHVAKAQASRDMARAAPTGLMKRLRELHLVDLRIGHFYEICYSSCFTIHLCLTQTSILAGQYSLVPRQRDAYSHFPCLRGPANMPDQMRMLPWRNMIQRSSIGTWQILWLGSYSTLHQANSRQILFVASYTRPWCCRIRFGSTLIWISILIWKKTTLNQNASLYSLSLALTWHIDLVLPSGLPFRP